MSVDTDKLVYRCPSCKTKISVDESLIDEIVDCPNEKCQLPFRVTPPNAQFVRGAMEDGTIPNEALPEINRAADTEENLVVEHPAMFRNRPLIYSLLMIGIFGSVVAAGAAWLSTYYVLSMIFLAVALGGLGVYVYWWIWILCTSLIVTTRRTILRYGILSKRTNEVQHDDVRNLRVNQTFVDRLFGVGALEVSSSGQDDMEIVVKGIVHPNEIADLIRTHQ